MHNLNKMNIFSWISNYLGLDPNNYSIADNKEFNEAIGAKLSQADWWDYKKNIYSYSKETAVDDDKQQGFIEYKDGIGYSHLGTWEAFALANNHYVYNGQYLHDHYPIQYEWLKNNIYKGHEFWTNDKSSLPSGVNLQTPR